MLTKWVKFDETCLGFKVYEYKNFKAYYLTLNGIQFGPIHFSEAEIKTSIAKLKRGESI